MRSFAGIGRTRFGSSEIARWPQPIVGAATDVGIVVAVAEEVVVAAGATAVVDIAVEVAVVGTVDRLVEAVEDIVQDSVVAEAVEVVADTVVADIAGTAVVDIAAGRQMCAPHLERFRRGCRRMAGAAAFRTEIRNGCPMRRVRILPRPIRILRTRHRRRRQRPSNLRQPEPWWSPLRKLLYRLRPTKKQTNPDVWLGGGYRDGECPVCDGCLG